MGGGDVKPEKKEAAGASGSDAAASAEEQATPMEVVEVDPVSLEVRPEYTLIAPSGPQVGTGKTGDEVMVMARIQAVKEVDDDRRAPVSICAVIDRR